MTRLEVAIQSQPFLSSASPKMGSRNDSGTSRGRLTWPELRKASPPGAPIQIAPVESSSRQFTFPGGKPSRPVYVRQRPCDSAFKPFGVGNHIDPSEVSRMAATVFDARPFALVEVVSLPFLKLLTPPLMVPAHTVPSRL